MTENRSNLEKTIVIILLGPPGGGKGTQAKKLVDRFDYLHISVGDVLRQEVREGSELGRQARDLMEAGELVPDQLVGKIIRNRLNQTGDGDGFILDGYPRNVNQAGYLESITGDKAVYAVNIAVEENQIIRRLSGRRFCQKCGNIYNIFFSPPKEPGICDKCGGKLMRRKDDREEVIQERLRVYREQTRPVIDFYKSAGNYHEVDGNWDPSDVFEELSKIVVTLQS